MTTTLAERDRPGQEQHTAPTSLRETSRSPQRQQQTTDPDGMNTTASAATRQSLRKASLRRHRSRDGQSESSKQFVPNQPLEPTGWRLSTLPVQLGHPLSLKPLDQTLNVSPTSPKADGGFLKQLKNYTQPHLDEDSRGTTLQKRNSMSRRHRNGNSIMLSNYATGRDHVPISPDANANLPLSPPGKTVYMPESPVTTGDKRIQQLKELQIPHADKKRVILGHAFGKSHSRQRPPRMAQRKKALLLNETDEERRKRERESVEAWRVCHVPRDLYSVNSAYPDCLTRPGRQHVSHQTTSPHDNPFRGLIWGPILRLGRSRIDQVDILFQGARVRDHPSNCRCT